MVDIRDLVRTNEDGEDFIDLDFRGLEAAQGQAFRAAHIPKGRYVLEISDAFYGKFNERKKAIQERSREFNVHFRVADGPCLDEEIAAFFGPVPRLSKDESSFPTERLIAMLEAIYGETVADRKVRMNPADWIGRQCLANVDDKIIPASADGKYAERTVSQPVAFDPLPEDYVWGQGPEDDVDDEPEPAPKARAAAPAPAQRAAAAKAPEPEPDDKDEGDDDDEGDEEPEAVAPAPAAKRNGRAAPPPDDDDGDDEGDDDEPEEVAVTPIRRAPAAATATRQRPAASDDDDPFGARTQRRSR